MPRHPRVLYNYGLTLERAGRRRAAETALLRAYDLDPDDPQIVYAIAVFYLQERHHRRAMTYARRLAQLTPTDPVAQNFLARLQRTIAGRGAQR